MAELLVRAVSQDAALLRRVFGVDGPGAPARPDRIVVDAHLPTTTQGLDIAHTARRVGIPFLVDPQTFYLQATQHPADRWANLPFGQSDVWSPTDAAMDALVAGVIEFQIDHGATEIIAPYVHVDSPKSAWISVQAALWHRTRSYADRHQIALPIFALLAVGWRVLQTVEGVNALEPMMQALTVLSPREVGLAASKVHQGVRPADRLMDLVLMIERLRLLYPVILWQQGHLGAAAVVAGAAGYECGIGWREACDLPAAARAHRQRGADGGPPARPVYLSVLGRSVAKRSLEGLRNHRDIWLSILCRDADCCPSGGQSLLGDARQHAIVQRARQLRQVEQIDRPVWKWQQLADAADAGLAVAERINRFAPASLSINRVDTGALDAIRAVGHTRRQDSRSRRVA